MRLGARQSQGKNPVQKIGIGKPIMLGGPCEFFHLRYFRIGFGFQEIRNALRRQAEIDAGIAVKLQRAADTLGQRADALAQIGG